MRKLRLLRSAGLQDSLKSLAAHRLGIHSRLQILQVRQLEDFLRGCGGVEAGRVLLRVPACASPLAEQQVSSAVKDGTQLMR